MSSISLNVSFAAKSSPALQPWYAIRTRSNQENVAALVLEGKGYEYYLPKYRARRRWSDRVVIAELPLFPGYVFCRFDVKQRLPILTTPGVVSIVGFGNEPVAIAESEIADIQAVLTSGLAAEPCPFLREGQRVRVKYGSLAGLEGILLKKKTDWRIIISVTMLQRSIAVEIDSDSITPI
ncbi:MAG: UpxY family transcription antiterminator [Acidobacteriaceae bacterium]|nr:UpxY family transcription antiterminator [Acidobacteriaceae bacterium]